MHVYLFYCSYGYLDQKITTHFFQCNLNAIILTFPLICRKRYASLRSDPEYYCWKTKDVLEITV